MARPFDTTELERAAAAAQTSPETGFHLSSVCARIAEEAAARPDSAAISFSGRTVSYGELERQSGRLARFLRRQGVGPETLVAVRLERSPELIVAILSVLQAGGAYVPLDPAYPHELTAFMLEDSGASVLITRGDLPERPMTGGRARVVHLEQDAERIAAESSERLAGWPDAATLAYVIYTSGSTGRPKGVCVEHRQLSSATAARMAYYGPSRERFLLLSSVAFDSSVAGIFGTLCRGGTLVLPEEGEHRDAAALCRLIGDGSVTELLTVPSFYGEILRAAEAGALARLRRAIVAGETCPPRLVAEHYRLVPGVPLFNEYGPTEATVWSTAHRCSARDASRSVPIGAPAAHTRAYVIDGRGVPAKEGELWIGGGGVARGYWQRPDLTAERFLPDPFESAAGSRLYRTGDLVRTRRDGDLEFIGRLDEQIKVRGVRVEPAGVEQTLLQHGGVREAAVIARPDPSGDPRLVAYFVPSSAAVPTASELRELLAEKLPPPMVPAAFVPLEALPRTASGKVDRHALPAASFGGDGGGTASPLRTATEQIVAGIWSELLGTARLGPQDDFFLLGGDSLLATRMASRIHKTLGVSISLRELYDRPRLGTLAEHLESFRGDIPAETPPRLQRITRDIELPLSFAQQRLWFLELLGGGRPVYNVAEAVVLKGPLDTVALARSLSEIVRRHESLRTVFPAREGVPRQTILPAASIELPIRDLRAVPTSRRRAEIQRRLGAEARRSFDLARGPLFRVLLLRTGEREHVLLLTTHHIVSDGWSFGVLYRELAAIYEAFRKGEPSPLPEPPFQYADFAAWQRERLTGEALESGLRYWRSQLAGQLPVLELPSDRPRPAVQSQRGRRRAVTLPAELAGRLRRFAREERASLFMTLLAGLLALIHRYTGREDLLVGTPVSGRPLVEAEGLIGFFVNTLVLRTSLSGDPSFRDLLARVRETALEAYANQDVPFERLVEEIQPERSVSHSPIFQVMFVLQNVPGEALQLPGLEAEPFPVDTGTAKFDLTLTLADGAADLPGWIEYSTDLFDEDTIGRLVSHLRTVLEGALADPDAAISRLPLLPSEERHRLLLEWNSTATALPERTVPELFEAQVERTPDAPALRWREETLSYRELNARANQLARYLRDRGVGPDELVSFCLPRSTGMIVAILGILKAGGAYVPLDPSYPPERTAFMLEDSSARWLLTDRALRDRFPSEGARVIAIDEAWPEISRESRLAPAPSARPEHLAYVIYTSGSTGLPKGVMITHRALGNYLAWTTGSLDIARGYAPVHSSIAVDLTVTSLFPPLLSGGQILLVPEGGPAELAAILRANEVISVLKLTPTHLSALGELLSPGEIHAHVAYLVVGGEVLSGEIASVWRAHFRGTCVFNEYGPTETAVGCSVWEVPNPAPGGPLPIGRPLRNVRLYVLDRLGELVPIGVPGELYVGGVSVGRGYWRRPELTAQRFVPDPFAGDLAARLYRTGDLVRYRSDGNLEFLARVDQQVKVRGFRVEPTEVEHVLLQHPAVREVAVAASEDAPGQTRLTAYVVFAGGAAVASPEQLRQFLNARLPEPMIPSTFVRLDTLPVTPGGKLDRKALPGPSPTRPAMGRVPPRDDVERGLVAIWEETLGVAGIGIRDGFFELGGHSLLAVRLFARIEKAFGRKLPLATLFQAGTIEQLAGVLRDDRAHVPWSSLVAIQPSGSLPPIFCFHPIGGNVVNYYELARRLGPNRPVYGLQAPGFQPGQTPHRTVEGMAAHYVRDIRAIAPGGPYLLAGLSFGGLIAFEAASQLRAAGEQVDLIALFDTYCPKYAGPLGILGRGVHLLEKTVKRASLSARNLLRSPDRSQYLREGLQRVKRRLHLRGRRVALRASRAIRRPDAGASAYEANLEAARAYSPRRYPGRVTLFLARDRFLQTRYDPRLAWKAFARGGLEIIEVTGDHARMLAEPQVALVAGKLEELFARSASRAEQQEARRSEQSRER